MRSNTIERRQELLKLEGLGFPESEIVKQLTEKYQLSERQIYYDFQTRNKWQLTPDAYQHYLKALNCLQQIYNRASLILITNTNNTNAQIGALRVMSDIAIKQTELSGYKPLHIDSSGIEEIEGNYRFSTWGEFNSKYLMFLSDTEREQYSHLLTKFAVIHEYDKKGQVPTIHGPVLEFRELVDKQVKELE